MISSSGELSLRKDVRIRKYSGLYFSAFGLNTDQSNSEYGHFLRSVCDQWLHQVTEFCSWIS